MSAIATTARIGTAFAACLVLGGVLVSGCSRDSAGSAAQPTSPTPTLSMSPTPPLSPVDSASRDALAAYRNMWKAFVVASRTSNPDAPQLRQYAQGQALRLIVSGLYTARDQGTVGRGDVQLQPAVTSTKSSDSPSTVAISDCVDDSKWLKYRKDGTLADKDPGGKHSTTAVVKRTSAGWKVDSFILKDKNTC